MSNFDQEAFAVCMFARNILLQGGISGSHTMNSQGWKPQCAAEVNASNRPVYDGLVIMRHLAQLACLYREKKIELRVDRDDKRCAE